MKKTTEQFAHQLKQKHNLTLTSEYLGAHENITFLCQNNHENTGMATNVLQRGYKCKQCVTGRKVVAKIKWTEELEQELQQLYDSGLSTKQIAEQLNTTPAAISAAVSKFNITRTKQAHTLSKLLKILDSQNRILLSEFLGVDTDVTVECEFKHTVTQRVNNILYLHAGCTECEKYKLTDKLIQALHTQDRVLLDDVCTGAHTLVKVRCKNNHVVSQLAANILYQDNGCKECSKGQQSSKPEKDLVNFIKQHYNGWIVENDRSICEGKELDIVLPDLGLCFEFNGTYWHSDQHVHKHYHQAKTNLVESIGFQLIHIHEYLWQTKNQLVQEKILNLLKPPPRIGARQCTYQQVTWLAAKEFLDTNHIQGCGSPTGDNHGLYYKGELVALATFAKPRFAKTHDLELIRFCSKIPIQGALSKLLKRVDYTKLITYALRDWSTGKLYKATNFELVGTTEPNYCYYKKSQRLTRYQAQKHKLVDILENFDPNLSEGENMRNNGWLRVWDSGNLVFSHCRR